MKKLIEIQKELKAPKNQYNSFGKYAYRSCEDIIEAAKPVIHKQNCILLINDEIIMVGDRFYIKATAIIKSEDQEFSVSAFARESLNKKGMDDAQITGSASSYARKYALNGLLAIDDNRDVDVTISEEIEKEVNDAKNEDDLREIYKKHGNKDNKQKLVDLITNRKEQLNNESK